MQQKQMKQYSFTIEGRLKGLNELIDANRRNLKAGAKLKKEEQAKVYWYIKQQLKGIKIDDSEVIDIDITWIEENIKRDKDNIASGKKYILDAMQEAELIKNDNWKHIRNITDTFTVDRKNPKIIVNINLLDKEEKEKYLSSLK